MREGRTGPARSFPPWRRAQAGRGALSSAGLAAYLLVAILPVAWLGAQALLQAFQPGGSEGVWSPRTAVLFQNSLSLATVVAGSSGLLGLGSALWIVSRPGRLARLARRVYLVPFIIPTYVYAITWMGLLNRSGGIARLMEAWFGRSPSPYGFGGAAAILSLAFAPLVTLMALDALEAIEPELVEMAMLFAPARRAWWRVVLPLILPAVVSAAGLVFGLALVEYGVPALLQTNVYSMEIYAEFSQSGDPRRAMLLALPLLVLATLLVSGSQWGLRRTPLSSRSHASQLLHRLPLPDVGVVVAWLGVLALAAAVLLPLLLLIFQASSPQAVFAAAGEAREDLVTSLLLGIFAALGAALLAFVPAWLVTKVQGGWLWAALLVPLAVPAPLFGIGLIDLANQLPANSVLPGFIMLWAAHVGRFLPLALVAMAVQFRRVEPLLLDMGRLQPVGWLRRLSKIDLPLLSGGIGVALVVVFSLSLGELGATLLVIPPGSGTVSLRLFNLLHYGTTQGTAALALCLLGVVLGAGGAALWIQERHDRRSAN